MLIGRSERQSRKSVRIYLLISHHIWLRHFTNSIVLQRRPKRYAEICLITRNRVTRLTPILIDKIARLLIFIRAHVQIFIHEPRTTRANKRTTNCFTLRARGTISPNCARGTIYIARAGQFLQIARARDNFSKIARARATLGRNCAPEIYYSR